MPLNGAPAQSVRAKQGCAQGRPPPHVHDQAGLSHRQHAAPGCMNVVSASEAFRFVGVEFRP